MVQQAHLGQLLINHVFNYRFERAPVVDKKRYWHLLPIKRSHTYRRLALEHGGAEGKVSECVIVRAHDRSLPLKLKMFYSVNRVQKTLGISDSKDAAQDWENPKVNTQLN